MHPQCLPDAEIQHDFFATARNGIGPDISVKPLDLSALSSTAVAQSSENLTGFPSTEFKGCGTLGFAAGNGSSEFQHGLHIVHLLALVDQVLEPVIRGLDLARHMCEFEADDGVIDETLAESLALMGVLDALFVADASEANTLDDDTNALVVEVGHDNLETLVLLSDQVLNRHLDVFEGNVGGTAGPDTLAVHLSGADAPSAALNEQNGDTVHAFAASADCSGEVVGPDTVGDPLLFTVHNVMLAVLRELGFTGQIGNIAASI